MKSKLYEEFEDAKKFYEDLGKQKDEKEDDKYKYRILLDDYTQKEYSQFDGLDEKVDDTYESIRQAAIKDGYLSSCIIYFKAKSDIKGSKKEYDKCSVCHIKNKVLKINQKNSAAAHVADYEPKCYNNTISLKQESK